MSAIGTKQRSQVVSHFEISTIKPLAYA